MWGAQTPARAAVQPLLPVSFLHPRAVLLYSVLRHLQQLDGKAPPGLLRLLARHREIIFSPHSPAAQVCACPGAVELLCSSNVLRGDENVQPHVDLHKCTASQLLVCRPCGDTLCHMYLLTTWLKICCLAVCR